MQTLVGTLLGVVFGVGLTLGGMTRPAKVHGFLDFGGAWDPSLAFVMIGAIAIYAPLLRLVVREGKPDYLRQFLLVAEESLDAPLFVGAAIFGLGWGLSGICPGPALVVAGTGASQGVVFASSMLAGMALFRVYEQLRLSRRAPRT